MTIEQLREIYKLKHIIRYNTRRHIKNESVAEHSFYVALISLILCQENNLDDKTTKDAIIKALLHDMPEIEINDITHDAKEKLHLRNYLKTYENDYYQRHFPEYFKLMSTDKGIASTIVDLADAMSVLQYSDNERLIGNVDNDMKIILDDSNERCAKSMKKLKTQLQRREKYASKKQHTEEQDTQA